jgi:hypothetical protein
MDGDQKTLSIFIVSLAVVILFITNAVYKYNLESAKFPKPERIPCACTTGAR